MKYVKLSNTPQFWKLTLTGNVLLFVDYI